MPTYDTYYSLLDLSPDLPSWALPKTLASAHSRYKELYGEDLPEPAATAFLVCGQQDGRADYDRLLELAALGPVQLEDEERRRLEQVADITHFKRDRRSDGLSHFRAAPLVLPEPDKILDVAGTSSDAVAAAFRANTATESKEEQPKRTGPPVPDEWGYVDGQFPRIRVGDLVFRIEYIEGYTLEATTELDTCVLMSFVRPDDGRRYSVHDYNAYFLNSDCRPTGVPYYFIQLINEGTEQRHFAGYCSREGSGLPYVASTGVFTFFPHHWTKGMTRWAQANEDWNKRYPGRETPMPTIFSEEPWDQYTKKVFADYVSEVFYWTRVCRRGPGENTQADVRKTAREMTSHLFLYYGFFPRKELPKLGLPTLPDYHPPKGKRKLFGLF